MKNSHENNLKIMFVLLIILSVLTYIFQYVDAVIIPNSVLLLSLTLLMIIVPAIFLKIIP